MLIYYIQNKNLFVFKFLLHFFDLNNNIIYHKIITTHFFLSFLYYFKKININYQYFYSNIKLFN